MHTQTHAYNTIQSHTHNNFIAGGISDWNELPTRITVITSFNLFMKNVSSFSSDKL